MADALAQDMAMIRFLSRHDLVYEAAPPTWDEGLPTARWARWSGATATR